MGTEKLPASAGPLTTALIKYKQLLFDLLFLIKITKNWLATKKRKRKKKTMN